MAIDYRNTQAYKKFSLQVCEEYKRNFLLDLSQSIRTAYVDLSYHKDLGTLTKENFIDEIAMAFAAIDRFLEYSEIHEIPTQEVLNQVKNIYRWGLEQFENMEFPEDFDRGKDLLISLASVIPRD